MTWRSAPERAVDAAAAVRAAGERTAHATAEAVSGAAKSTAEFTTSAARAGFETAKRVGADAKTRVETGVNSALDRGREGLDATRTRMSEAKASLYSKANEARTKAMLQLLEAQHARQFKEEKTAEKAQRAAFEKRLKTIEDINKLRSALSGAGVPASA